MKEFVVNHYSSHGGGFSMTFANGTTVSVAMNTLSKTSGLEVKRESCSCDLAEVMAWDDEGAILFDGANEDQPCHPMLAPDEVLSIMIRAALGTLRS